MENRNVSRGSTMHPSTQRKGSIMSFNRNSRRFAIALALSAGLSAMPVLAQPGQHGRHGGHEGGLAHAIIALKAQLNLTAQQQAALDSALTTGKAARQAARQSMQTVHQLARDELAKDMPDL